ncbi:restriction endonuclease [Effusibacillus pohliae]|uniref:restriction endonuclease n=1 Tax=Effusibacillus pohliae TaxID=232270 RepID=UPI00036EE852|nr:restriction endonuclease [Effusibacillus pohliae]
MAKRRKRKHDDFVGSLVVLLMLGAFWMAFDATRSFTAGLVAMGIVFGIAYAIVTVVHMMQEEKLKRSGIYDIDKMDGRQFELYLGHLFRSQGYSVEVTRSSGDYGADLVLQKDGKKIVVQAKRYSSRVGNAAVQQARAAMDLYGASEAWVVTNSEYTDQAYVQAKASQVRLIDRKELMEMILKMNPNAVPKPKQIMAENPQTEFKCDQCGNTMVLRKGPKGEFYGCSGYPKCRNIKAAPKQSYSV